MEPAAKARSCDIIINQSIITKIKNDGWGTGSRSGGTVYPGQKLGDWCFWQGRSSWLTSRSEPFILLDTITKELALEVIHVQLSGHTLHYTTMLIFQVLLSVCTCIILIAYLTFLMLVLYSSYPPMAMVFFVTPAYNW